MKYPKHIYDPIRYEVAANIISHELKKLFPSFSHDEYQKLSGQILEWPLDPKKYSLSPEPRDFWNGVEGIMTGFRLKGVVKFITSENVSWTKEKVSPLKFIFTTDHFSVNNEKIPTLNKSASEVLSWLKEKGYLEEATKKVEEDYRVGIPRVADPIYCKKDDKGSYFAFDGNGRVLYALLKNIDSISAFVGVLEGEKPRNYWIYTMLLIRISQLHSERIITLDEYKKILKYHFEESKSAIVEYKERVPDEESLKNSILQEFNIALNV